MVYSSSIDLNQLSPLVLVAKEFLDITVNPYVQDEFLFIGLEAKQKVEHLINNNASNSTTNGTAAPHSLFDVIQGKNKFLEMY